MSTHDTNELVVSLRIGKNGLSPGMLNEIKSQLKKKGVVKIKMLKSFTGGSQKDGQIEKIESSTDSVLVRKTGFVAIFREKKTIKIASVTQNKKRGQNGAK